jgi:hypothetical protein
MLIRGARRAARTRRVTTPSRVGSIAREERGAAILTVITLITVGLAVGGVAAVTASNAMRGSVRDESSKDALAAADAGAQVALMRQNQVGVDDVQPCVGLDPVSGEFEPQGLLGGDWCPDVAGAAGDASYEYRVRRPSPIETSPLVSQVEVVSTGESNGVTRRIHVIAESPRANAVFADQTVLSNQNLELSSNAQILANSAANGNVMTEGSAVLCGGTQFGEGMAFLPDNPSQYDHQVANNCPSPSYPESEGSVTLLDVDQGEVADPDHNVNTNITPQGGNDPCNPAPATISGDCTNVLWNPATRVLELKSNSSLTLGGGDYSFCRLVLDSNTELIVAQFAKVKIFFDSPENCGLTDGATQIEMRSNSRLTTTSGLPGDLMLLVVGSEADPEDPDFIDTNILIDSNSRTTMPMILYAPRSDITLDSNSTLIGAVAGRSVTLRSNARVIFHSGASELEIPLPFLYRQTRFVECTSTPAPADAPSSAC